MNEYIDMQTIIIINIPDKINKVFTTKHSILYKFHLKAINKTL